MKTADRLRQIAELADSIEGTCGEIADAWTEWDDVEGLTAAERAEQREDTEQRIDELAGELMAEARKMQALHPLYADPS